MTSVHKTGKERGMQRLKSLKTREEGNKKSFRRKTKNPEKKGTPGKLPTEVQVKRQCR